MINRLKQTNEKDVIANRYVFGCLTCETIVMLIILVLSITGIFTVRRSLTVNCVILCNVIYLLAVPVRLFADMSRRWVKYYLILVEIIFITVVATMLTYHAILACAMPILSASMYSTKKISVYTYLLMIVSTAVSVFVGYRYGVCDANMVLLTSEPLSYYINDYKEFSLNTINSQEVYTLSVFFVLPRCMILFAYVIFCNSITKVLNKNIDYAQKMEGIAERDGLTGLYNKSKYLQMKESDYQKRDKVGIIYFDINYLKRVNDELGHEWGDALICTVAKGLKEISDSQNCVYRVGGDEFVMVLPDADNNTVEKKVEEWNLTIAKMQSETHLDISVSYGYACGNGKDFEKIASEADQGMYEYKRKIHSADA